MRGRIWVGLFLIVFGIGYFLQHADLLNFTQVLSTWWPLILIIIGITQLINRTHASPISGLIFLMAGALFLVNQWVDFNVAASVWPLILIVVGFVFLFPRNRQKSPRDTEQFINTFALFSGADVNSQSDYFAGGSVTTVFGGAEVDLRDAHFQEETKMDLTTVFGGIDLAVPENVHVEISGFPLFGGWDDRSKVRTKDEQTTVLKINCLAVFGGVEVKN